MNKMNTKISSLSRELEIESIESGDSGKVIKSSHSVSNGISNKLGYILENRINKMSNNTVINLSGYPIEFDSAIYLMDTDIMNQLLSDDYLSTGKQFYFTAYELAHYDKFNEYWELSNNPDIHIEYQYLINIQFK